MSEKRFVGKINGMNNHTIIEDKYDDKIFDETCPVFHTLKDAKDFAEWLNRNTKPYARFVLELDKCNGITMYNIIDNKTGENIPFIPRITKTHPEYELKKFVEWLNGLVEK